MTRKAPRNRRDPLLAALNAADKAIHADGPPTERVARALLSLADGLAAMLATSDLASPAGRGAEQVLARFRGSQSKRISEIRAMAKEAETSGKRGLADVSKRARSATRSAVRSEVKKRRIRRRSREDGPGGQG